MRIPVLLALALVAGCISPEEPVESASVDPPADVQAAVVPDILPLDENATPETPAWRAGDAWLIESYDDDLEVQRGALVVVRADSDAYQVRTTIERLAMYDAMFDMSYLGRIRASDLAGSQREDAIRFFDFPLAHGKSWTTRWDGGDVTLTSTFSPAIPTHLGPQPGFVIQGVRADGEPHVEYDYVPALRWWSKVAFSGGYGFRVVGVAENWTGEVLEGTAKTLLTLRTAAPVASTPAGAFTVDPDQSFVVLRIVAQGSAAAGGLLVLDPEHKAVHGPEPHVIPERFWIWQIYAFEAKPGAWHVASPALHSPDATFELEAIQVALRKVAVGPL